MELTAQDVRVLGCLIEKGATTPDHYPLSTNALVNACNQKSNRDPVVEYDERLVVDTMLAIRLEGLARTNASGRADKHRHILHDALGLDQDQLAVLGVMMLRGPQSAGELKTRTERYSTSRGHGFESIDDIESVLAGLADRHDPLVTNIGRASGQSQDRWAHLFAGEAPSVHGATSAVAPPPTEPVDRGPSLAVRVEQLEARLATIEDALGMPAASAAPTTVDPE